LFTSTNQVSQKNLFIFVLQLEKMEGSDSTNYKETNQETDQIPPPSESSETILKELSNNLPKNLTPSQASIASDENSSYSKDSHLEHGSYNKILGVRCSYVTSTGKTCTTQLINKNGYCKIHQRNVDSINNRKLLDEANKKKKEEEKQQKINPDIKKLENMSSSERKTSFLESLKNLTGGSPKVDNSSHDKPLFDESDEEEIKEPEEDPVFYSSEEESEKIKSRSIPTKKPESKKVEFRAKEVHSSDDEISDDDRQEGNMKFKALSAFAKQGYYMTFENIEYAYPETFAGLSEDIKSCKQIDWIFETAVEEVLEDLGIPKHKIKCWHVLVASTLAITGNSARKNMQKKDDEK
jgi:hypothetical protein